MYGHEDKKKLFSNLVKEDNLAHAYLFYGDPQIGKYLFSLCLANFLENKLFEISEKIFLDSVIINPEEGKIGIGDLKIIKEFIYKRPLKSSKRLIIINDSEKMTPQAQNSVLKFVEESPSHVTFIFISHTPNSLLSPLLSRLIKIYFERMSDKELKKYLSKEFEGKEINPEIIDESFGRIGRAIDLIKNGNSHSKEDDLSEYLEKKILKLYFNDKVKNASKLSHLLKKESELKRFNLNPKLQEKVIKEII